MSTEKDYRLKDWDTALATGEVAELFRVDVATVRRWEKKGKLPAFRTIGGHLRFRVADVLPYLEAVSGIRRA